MKYQRLEIPLKTPVKSLIWQDDSLIDWAAGNRVIGFDGTDTGSKVRWSYHFDAAIQSPSRRHAAIYERLGTKGVILDRGKFVREINRSFYHADAYEYPIVFFQHADGRELIAHCPDEYNRIEIDEVTTGNRLTASTDRKPRDFFHSRLALSADNQRLLSAGWAWHPFSSISTWSITDILADPRTLDISRPPMGPNSAEINAVIFIDSDRILMNSSPEAEDLTDDGESDFRAGSLGVFNLNSNAFESITKIEETVGNMLWLGNGKVVGFYETPKVFDLNSGKVIFRWPDIASGKQDGSIIHHLQLPSIAIDSVRKRFAVAVTDKISVVQLQEK
jgi:hypothetical protein